MGKEKREKRKLTQIKRKNSYILIINTRGVFYIIRSMCACVINLNKKNIIRTYFKYFQISIFIY